MDYLEINDSVFKHAEIYFIAETLEELDNLENFVENFEPFLKKIFWDYDDQPFRMWLISCTDIIIDRLIHFDGSDQMRAIFLLKKIIDLRKNSCKYQVAV